MSKHTPGPWHISTKTCGDGTVYHDINAEDTYDLCTCHELFDKHGDALIDESNSNAHLIAAAPDLLAALEELMDQANYDAEDYAQNGNEDIWACINGASEAIAKAKGE